MNSQTHSPDALTAAPFTVIFYVADVEKSCKFYSDVLGRGPADSYPMFALYPLAGTRLGLWATADVEPRLSKAGVGDEVCFAVSDNATVDATCERWRKLGVAIAQEPTVMDFGYTFVGLDPDGHRLRVYAPSAPKSQG